MCPFEVGVRLADSPAGVADLGVLACDERKGCGHIKAAHVFRCLWSVWRVDTGTGTSSDSAAVFAT